MQAKQNSATQLVLAKEMGTWILVPPMINTTVLSLWQYKLGTCTASIALLKIVVFSIYIELSSFNHSTLTAIVHRRVRRFSILTYSGLIL